MGKKARLKAERRASASASTPSIKQTFHEVNFAQKTALYEELHGALWREHQRYLNDQPFSHPDNLGKLDKTFGPMEKWLDEQVRTGEAEALRDGTVIFRPEWDQDEYYPVDDSFITVADTFELIAADLKIPDESDGLRKLGKRIKADMPLDMPAVEAAKKSLAWMRWVTMSLSPRTLHPFTEAISTREEFKRLGVIQK